MIHVLGEMTLVLALVVALLQSVLPMLGVYYRQPYLLASARPLALAQGAYVVLAFLLLMIAFMTNDFSIAYVALNSHQLLPLFYRATALWGGHEGSILLWILMLNLWAMIYLLTHRERTPLHALVIAILGMISFAFLCFLYFTSNPFLSLPFKAAGQDLNPLLQDPGFVIHPPMLYAGYVGFSIVFAITLAAVILKKLDTTWAISAQHFALAAWSFLTGGIILGSWWAYRVLGWGGFWFWDPVENASLLPWLSGTALIHVLLLVKKRGMAKAWASLLALITFSLSLLGTFLVRSGVLISVHAFANDPRRGIFLLLLLATITISSLIIYILCIPISMFTKHPFSRFSKERGLLINSALLIIAMCTVLLGTIYPLIFDALHLNAISVGAPYFNTVMIPLVFTMLILMGFAVRTEWQKENTQCAPLKNFPWKIMAPITLIAWILLWRITNHMDVMVFFGFALCMWVILSVFNIYRHALGVSLAHVGFAVMIIGVLLTTTLSQEKALTLKPGKAATLGPYHFFFVEINENQGPNYLGIRGVFDVFKNNRFITQLLPEKRIYTIRQTIMTKAAIHPGVFRDLYIALGEPLANDDWSLHIYYKPFVRWIWFGGILMILGGLSAIVESVRQNGSRVKS